MFCISCGAENPDEARFCRKCGKPFVTAPVTAPKATIRRDPTIEEFRCPYDGSTARSNSSDIWFCEKTSAHCFNPGSRYRTTSVDGEAPTELPSQLSVAPPLPSQNVPAARSGRAVVSSALLSLAALIGWEKVGYSTVISHWWFIVPMTVAIAGSYWCWCWWYVGGKPLGSIPGQKERSVRLSVAWGIVAALLEIFITKDSPPSLVTGVMQGNPLEIGAGVAVALGVVVVVLLWSMAIQGVASQWCPKVPLAVSVVALLLALGWSDSMMYPDYHSKVSDNPAYTGNR